MDKAEYNLKLEEIYRNVDQGNYEEAAKLADGIDWKRVRNVRTLCIISEIYEAEGRYEDSKALLQRAYRRTPVGRTVLYRLVEVTIALRQFDEAIEYYSEYCQAAPHDNSRYILKYQIYKGRGSSVEEQIEILKEYLDQEYNEKYAYELATLYQQADRIGECLATCDDLVLWFHSGKYVIKALELKKKYAPLTPKQQEIYDRRFEEEDEDSFGSEKSLMEAEDSRMLDSIVEDAERSIAQEVTAAAEEIRQNTEAAGSAAGGTKVRFAGAQEVSPEAAMGEGLTRVVDTERIRQAAVRAEGSGIAAAQEAGESLAGAAQEVQEAGEEAAQAAGSAVTGAAEAAGETAGEIFGEVTEAAEAAADAAQEAADGTCGAVEQAAQTIDRAATGAAELAGEAAQAAESAATGAAELAGEAAQAAESAATGAARHAGEAAQAAESAAAMTGAGSLAAESAEEETAEGGEAGQADHAAAVGAENSQVRVGGADISWAPGEETSEQTAPQQVPEYDPKKLQEEAARNMRQIVTGIGGVRDSSEEEDLADQVIEESKKDQEEARAAGMISDTGEIRLTRKLEMPQKRKTPEGVGQLSIDDILLSMGERGEAVREAASKAAAPSKQQPEGVLSAVDEALLNMGIEPEAMRKKRLEEEEQKKAEDAEKALEAVSDAPDELMEEAKAQAERDRQAARSMLEKAFADENGSSRAEARDGIYDDGMPCSTEETAGETPESIPQETAENASETASEKTAENAPYGGLSEEAVLSAKTRRIPSEEIDRRFREGQWSWRKRRAEKAAGELAEAAEPLKQETGWTANEQAQTAVQAEDSRDTQASGAQTAAPAEDARDIRADDMRGTVQAEDSRNTQASGAQTAAPAGALPADGRDEAGDGIDMRPLNVPESGTAAPAQEAGGEAQAEGALAAETSAQPAEGSVVPAAGGILTTTQAGAGKVLPPKLQDHFAGFTEVPGLEGAIAYAIEQALAKGQDRTSRTGNILITGGHGYGKTTIAIGLAKAICQARGSQYVKMARIYATDLSRKDIASTIAKIAGGILIIEEAGDLSDQTADQLTTAMEFRTDGLIIIMEDEKKYLQELLTRHPRFGMKFTSQIHLPEYTSDQLVNFARVYADDQNYTLSEEAEETLKAKLAGMNTGTDGEGISLIAVSQVVEKAIGRANKLLRKAFSGKKRLDPYGRVILQSKDFR